MIKHDGTDLKIELIIVVYYYSYLKLHSQGFASVTQLSAFTVTKNTGEKPQSKVWAYDGRWWSVFPDTSGTYIWRLDGNSWNQVLKIASNSIVKADCKVVHDVCHIFLWKKADSPSTLVSVEYVPSAENYKLWSKRSSTVLIQLDSGTETGTIDIDATGRMWLASDGVDDIRARWSDPPYVTWSAPIIIASGVKNDDIGAVISLPVQGQVGILWSNQNTKRFGFKTHANGADPSVWSADELPASQSALDTIGMGMSDDQLNMALASDGTLYCAIKTGYDTPGYPLVALLKRQPNGIWDDLYEVSQTGTRPITVLNEAAGKLKVIFPSQEGGGDILYSESPIPDISFGPLDTLITGAYDNPTSTKDNYDPAIVILASTLTQVVGVIAYDDSAQTIPLAPELRSPADSSVDIVRNPTFVWEATANADSYELQVALSPDFSNFVYSKPNIISTSIEIETMLNYDTQYHWRVRAANTAGYSDWSLPWRFTTSTRPIVPGIAGYWKLDEGMGTMIIDESDYGNNGETIGGPLWVHGVYGSGLKLNGSNQYAIVQDSPSLDISEGITLAAWMRPEKKSLQHIIFKGDFKTDGYALSLLKTRRVSLAINQNTSFTYRINSNKSYPVDGKWMHIAATFNGTVLKIFINGFEDKRIAFSSPTSIMMNSLPLAIGASANATNFFKGTIDDVRIYNYALSDSEIKELVSGLAAKNTETARVAQPKSIQQTTNQETGEDPTEYKIGIYPNPAQNTLFVDLPPGSENTISISDMYGRVFYRTITTGVKNTFTINLDEFNIKSGLYLLLRQSSDSMTIKKFFKK